MDSTDSQVSSLFQAEIITPQESLPEITANRIREMIYNHKLRPGARLPNELELSEAMGVSRGTLRTALNILQEQGLIWRRQGIGSFISEQPILEQRLDINNGVTELIVSMGLTPGTKVLEIKLTPADDYQAERLNIPLGNTLVFIRRIRTANGRPVVASVDIFPSDILQQSARHLELDDLKTLLEQRLSIYKIFESEFGLTVDYGISRIKPVKMNTLQLKQIGLDLPAGSVMLFLEQVDYDRDRRPFYLSLEYHAADFCTFTIFRRR
jgi:GntR family transcriptional regulator